MSEQLIQQYYNQIDKYEQVEEVVELLGRVTAVSVETMRVIGEMENGSEDDADG
jgi:hypothetical protein